MENSENGQDSSLPGGQRRRHLLPASRVASLHHAGDGTSRSPATLMDQQARGHEDVGISDPMMIDSKKSEKSVDSIVEDEMHKLKNPELTAHFKKCARWQAWTMILQAYENARFPKAHNPSIHPMSSPCWIRTAFPWPMGVEYTIKFDSSFSIRQAKESLYKVHMQAQKELEPL
eukprot:3130090-Amphidinium_carterae.1